MPIRRNQRKRDLVTVPLLSLFRWGKRILRRDLDVLAGLIAFEAFFKHGVRTAENHDCAGNVGLADDAIPDGRDDKECHFDIRRDASGIETRVVRVGFRPSRQDRKAEYFHEKRVFGRIVGRIKTKMDE